MAIRIPELFAHSTKGKGALGDALRSSVLVSEEAENQLIERLGELAPDRQWAENYLDLVQELVEVSGLSNDDPRLAMTLPEQKVELPVNIT
jgi:ribosome assembly protein YihI (activator of Der GTPase)